MYYRLKLIIRVPNNGSFDAQIKILETIENVQIELYFILTIAVPHVGSFGEQTETLETIEHPQTEFFCFENHGTTGCLIRCIDQASQKCP